MADNWDEVNIKNNIFNGNAGSNLSNFYSSEYPPIYTYSDNQIADPLFTGANDYTLQVGSPAIDAGLGVGLNLDYLGNAVGASPDIGAYEYDSTPLDPPPLPVCTTSITSYTSVSALVAGTVTDDEGTVTARGICYSESANPTTANSVVPSGGGTGAFSCTLRLSSNTLYHVRSYATNASGTSYGSDETFSTALASAILRGGKVITRDGKAIYAD